MALNPHTFSPQELAAFVVKEAAMCDELVLTSMKDSNVRPTLLLSICATVGDHARFQFQFTQVGRRAAFDGDSRF